MTTLSGGTFLMGSNEDAAERPIHRVTLKPFAISRYPVSVREWNACAAAKACAFVAKGSDDAPATNVSFRDARQFVTWLAAATHKPYRLPSEAEWEYAARGGTQTKYWWGNAFTPGLADCKDCTDVATAAQPVKVGRFKPNPFGLYDMGGGVDQWVADCWHGDYGGAPSDGSPWVERDCGAHVIRSGSWQNDSWYVRPSSRDAYDTNVRYPTHGFRVALELTASPGAEAAAPSATAVGAGREPMAPVTAMPPRAAAPAAAAPASATAATTAARSDRAVPPVAAPTLAPVAPSAPVSGGEPTRAGLLAQTASAARKAASVDNDAGATAGASSLLNEPAEPPGADNVRTMLFLLAIGLCLSACFILIAARVREAGGER